MSLFAVNQNNYERVVTIMKEKLQKFFSNKRNVGVSIGAIALIVVAVATFIVYPYFLNTQTIDDKTADTSGSNNIVTPAVEQTNNNTNNNSTSSNTSNNTSTVKVDNTNSQTPTVAPKKTDPVKQI